jgi:outer membrane receptor for ferrienterochelin and colicins
MIDIDLAGGSASTGVAEYSYRNFGQARTAGAQLDLGTRVGDRFRADLGYAYLWTRDDLNDRPLGGRPPHTLTASLTASLGWKLEGYLRWRVNSHAFVDEDTRAPGYQTVDLRLARTLWPRSQAYVGVLNLLDAHQEAGRVGDLRPPLGRVFYLGLRAELPTEDD